MMGFPAPPVSVTLSVSIAVGAIIGIPMVFHVLKVSIAFWKPLLLWMD